MTRPRKPKLELTREQGWGRDDLMVIAAFRYSCGRSSYIVGVCADWLIRIWPMLSENTRFVIKRDLEADFESDDKARAEGDTYKPLGWDCDRKEWERVRNLWRNA
jgi:hypothetical protein